MATDYLNKNGLSYFWGKIKAWANAAFAAISHTHASSDVTAMTGYSKPSSTSDIASTDTLNQAVGKLEKAIDDADISNVVHRTGDETIDGSKTFSKTVRTNGAFYINRPALVPGVPLSEALYTSFSVTNAVNDVVGQILFFQNSGSSGLSGIVMRVCGNVNSSDMTWHAIGLSKRADGTAYAYAPTPSSASNDSDEIATTEWVRDATGDFACNAATASKLKTARSLKVALGSTTAVTFDGSAAQNSIPVSGTLAVANGGTGSSTKNFVDLSTAQTIGGEKTFTSDIFIRGEGDVMQDNPNITFGTYPSGITHCFGLSGRAAGGSTTETLCYLSGFTNEYGSTYLRLACRRNASGSDYFILQLIATSTPSFQPSSNGNITLGDGSHRWKQLYATTTTISTSDRRLKDEVAAVPDEVLDAWGAVGFVQFKMRDAVAGKGSALARLHSGLVAQDVASAFSARGLDASRYGLFCHDEWPYAPVQKDGKNRVAVEERQAGDVYSLRYEEALCMEAAYMRRENSRLKKRVADLEERLAALEMKLS